MINNKMVAVAAVVITSMVTANALASTKKKQSSSSSSSSASMPAANTAAAAPAASSSASIPKPEEAPKKWTIEAYNKTILGYEDALDRKGTATTQNYVGVAHKLSDTKTLGIRQLFLGDFPKDDQKANMHMANTYVHYTDSKVAALPAGFTLSTTVRQYAPTGEAARFEDKNRGATRLYLIASKSVGKLDLSGVLLAHHQWNSQDTYMKDGKVTNNMSDYIFPYVEAAYNITPKLAIAQDIGTENTYNLGAGAATQRDLDLSTTVSYAVLPQLTLTGTIDDTIETEHPANDSFRLYRKEDMKVVFEVIATL